MTNSGLSLDSFSTFGDLLKYLRRRARLTQRELSIAVKYSEASAGSSRTSGRPTFPRWLRYSFPPSTSKTSLRQSHA
jgi:hypothetical protein